MGVGRRQYPFDVIEPKWQRRWEQEQTFRAWNPGETVPADHPFAQLHGANPPERLPKFYILDMFPYPSGAGLHVGHPEGYSATDILARYRRAQGNHVLHPMGWDAFGLPAEQYAIKTGQHPRQTTEQNVATFKRQIQALGFSYDWSREVNTTDPAYYKWTQWIFLKLYNSWFNTETNRAEPIETLSYPPELKAATGSLQLEARRRVYRDSKRLAYVTEAPVWWCEQLGTVLANEEVVEGLSEVGGFPVVRRPMRQWMLRITAYAQRLLDDLAGLQWTDSLKEMQRNWIGRSEGAEVEFAVADGEPGRGAGANAIRVFTTRPDTLFGATYMVLAPEHPLVSRITTGEQRAAVEAYRLEVAKKSDLERTELAKDKTGVFTGAYARNPVTGQQIPVWIADYVLLSYGTGAIMAVPGHDTRDLEFAQKFSLPIVQVVEPPDGKDWRGYVDDGVAINSANERICLDGLPTPAAKERITAWLESGGLGRKLINFKLRDWLFSRQRYWGEPFPIVWKRDAAGQSYHEALPESELPLMPPALQDYKPTLDGQPPLARATAWVKLPDGSERETNTMPQWAGSCWYYLRYLDAQNDDAFCSPHAERYWMGAAGTGGLPEASTPTSGVDLYVGGTEHAVLHLLYARFWHKVLFDLGYVSSPEPFFRLVNQGLILGEDGQKMSKSRGNVVNPDDILAEYGADAFRLYEMFLGPLEMVKPWNTKGIKGVYGFLGRVWRLFIDETSQQEFEQTVAAEPGRAEEFLSQIQLSSAIEARPPEDHQLKALHATIKKVTEDLDGLRFNTAIAALMVFINEAMTWKVKPAVVLRDFLILLQPFAPHLAEELWARLRSTQVKLPDRSSESVIGLAAEPAAPTADFWGPHLAYVPWPKFDPSLLIEAFLEIAVQVNGKLRDVIRVPATSSPAEIEKAARGAEKAQPFLEGKTVRKVIVVPKKLVNLVVG